MSLKLKCQLMLKFIFYLARFFCMAFRDNYMKTNKDTPLLSKRKKCSPMALVSGDV